MYACEGKARGQGYHNHTQPVPTFLLMIFLMETQTHSHQEMPPENEQDNKLLLVSLDTPHTHTCMSANRESVDGAEMPRPPYIGKAFTRPNIEDLSLSRYLIMLCK